MIDSKELTVWKACVEGEQQLTSMETVRFQAAQRLGEVGGVTGRQIRKCHKPSSLCLALRSSLVLPLCFYVYAWPLDYLGEEEIGGGEGMCIGLYPWSLLILGKQPQAFHDSEVWERISLPLVGK